MILKPFEFLYQFASSVKNKFYDLGILSSAQLKVPVISVGNLSFGGTGKTPFIEFLAKNLADKKIVIVCRSYRASLKVPQKVNLKIKNAAHIYGDEAYLLQKKIPTSLVWSGPTKSKTALAALTDQPDVILVDDGFSHRQLKRNFDLVLIDSTKLYNDYFRERFSSLHRASAVVLTKSQDANRDQLLNFKKALSEKFPQLSDSIFEAETRSTFHVKPESPVIAFCGVALPEVFRESLINQNLRLIHFSIFQDHQIYTDSLQDKMWSDYCELRKLEPFLKILTTEKDFNKLTHSELIKNTSVVDYVVEMQPPQKEKLLEKIRNLT